MGWVELYDGLVGVGPINGHIVWERVETRVDDDDKCGSTQIERATIIMPMGMLTYGTS